MSYIYGLEPIKEAMIEYIENIISLSYPYMKSNHINYDLSGNDSLSVHLRLLIDISDKIKMTNSRQDMIVLKDKILTTEAKINQIIQDGGINYGHK